MSTPDIKDARVMLFEDRWAIALFSQIRGISLSPDLLAKIRATQKDDSLGKERREVPCTPSESMELLTFYTEGARIFALRGDNALGALCDDARANVVHARNLAGH